MLRPEWLGRVPYADAHAAMRARRHAILEADGHEAFWLLEHDEVVTLGRRAAEGVDVDRLQARSIEVVRTERGGLATWHGPGQLLGYPVVHLGRRGLGVRRYVEALEDGVMRWLSGKGLSAHRRPGATGVWIADRKLCAIGVHVARSVAIHGFALNVAPVAGAFQGIVPCGIRDGRPGSLSEEGLHVGSVHDIALDVGAAVLAALVDAAGDRR